MKEKLQVVFKEVGSDEKKPHRYLGADAKNKVGILFNR